MVSRVEQAKEKQAYTDKFIPGTCGNCAQLHFKMRLPRWMEKSPHEWGDDRKQQKDLRCGIGGFAVKRGGSCVEWCGKPETVSA